MVFLQVGKLILHQLQSSEILDYINIPPPPPFFSPKIFLKLKPLNMKLFSSLWPEVFKSLKIIEPLVL
jgi:hypothetical protein